MITDGDEDIVICAGCDEPGGIEIVTVTPFAPRLGWLITVFGAGDVAAWHGVCWVDADMPAARTIPLEVPFTGIWEDLDEIAPDGLEGRRRMWGAVKCATVIVAFAAVAAEVAEGWMA